MPGGFSSKRSRRFTSARFIDPNPQRSTSRITNIYATPLRIPEDKEHLLTPLPEHFRLGRNAKFYAISKDQLPKVLHSESLNPAALTFQRWTRDTHFTGARLWIFAAPSRQIVVVLTLDTDLPKLLSVIEPLEDCYYLDLKIHREAIGAYLGKLMERFVDHNGDLELLPERHQIAFGPSLPDKHCEDTVQRIIYRQNLPYRKQYSSIAYPPELNRRPGQNAGVGPYVSAICGHLNDVENSALVSAVQGVASAARLREIRQAAYEAVASFRHVERAPVTVAHRRRILEDLADRLSHLELELSHSVEAPADIGLLVPSLRVEGYHVALFEAMRLSHRADIAARMLERLERSINAEVSTVQSIERRADDDRRLRWTVAVGFISTVAIPLTIILAFFGANSAEIKPGRSMFDGSYLGFYVTISLILFASVLPSIWLYIQQRRRSNGGDVS